MSVHVLHADNEWRFDPVDARWSLVTKNRRTVPPLEVAAPAPERALRESVPCAFCIDPPAGPLARLADEGGREALAFPSPTPLCFVEHGPPPKTPFATSGALGAHEVLVPTGELHHDAHLATVEPDALALLLLLALRRLAELAGDTRLAHARVAILPPALSRLKHVHASLLALPHEAPRPASCPVCEDLDHARSHGRLVAEQDGVCVWVPFAPRGDVHVRVALASHGMNLTGDGAQAATLSLSRRLSVVARACLRLAPGAPVTAASGPLPLHTQDGHLLVDVEVPFDVDAALGRVLGASVATVAPEALAPRLSAALPAGV